MKKSSACVRSGPATYRSVLKLFAYLGKPEVIGAQSERRDGTASSVPHVSRKLTVFTSRLLTIRLFCGAGCAGAHAEVIEFARKLKALIVHAFRGQGVCRIR